MQTIYLKFTDKEEMYNVLSDFRITEEDEQGNERIYWKSGENISFDEVGIIYKPTGNTTTVTDPDGNSFETPELELADGYHLNILCRTENEANQIYSALGENKEDYLPNPSNPSRTFA